MRFPQSESYFKNSLLLDTLQSFTGGMSGRLLDLGCGNKPYYNIYSRHCTESVGCDVPHSLHSESEVEVLCAAEEIDKFFEKDSFDCVICTEVIEHTYDDEKVIANISNVLATGGTLLISAPFIYVLHEEPHDYKRYTYYGIENLLLKNNFRIEASFAMGGVLSSGFLVLYYFFMRIFTYGLKKIGLKKFRDSNVLKFFISLPEFAMYQIYKPFFKRKLKNNLKPGKSEKFSSTGYFFYAVKNESPA